MIPEDWTNYLVPVSCPSAYQYLRTNNKPLNAGYTMGLPKDCTFLSETKLAWVGDCKTVENKYHCELEFNLDAKKFVCLDSSVNKVASQDDDDSATDTEPLHSDMSHHDNPNHHGKQSNVIDKSKNGSHGNQSSHDNQNNDDNSQSRIDDLNQYTDNHGNQSCYSNHGDQCEHSSHDNQGNLATSNPLHDNNIKKTKQDETNVKKQKFNMIDSCHGDEQSPSDTYLHGFIGYFTSTLYKDITIDTRHTSNRNSFHWECYFVPVLQPIIVKQNCKVKLAMSRKTLFTANNRIKLWYEWQAGVENTELSHELEGKKSKKDGMFLDLTTTSNSTTRTKFDGRTEKERPHGKYQILSLKNRKDEDGQFIENVSMLDSNTTSKDILKSEEYGKEDAVNDSSLEGNSTLRVAKRKFPLQNKGGNNDAVYLS